MMPWKLIIDGAMDGSRNMAVDAALLSEAERTETPVTIVRFYGWIIPTISLGRSQQVAKAVDIDYCRTNGIDIVHRPTRLPSPEPLDQEMAGVAEFLAERPTIDQLRGALIRAFQDYFSIEFML